MMFKFMSLLAISLLFSLGAADAALDADDRSSNLRRPLISDEHQNRKHPQDDAAGSTVATAAISKAFAKTLEKAHYHLPLFSTNSVSTHSSSGSSTEIIDDSKRKAAFDADSVNSRRLVIADICGAGIGYTTYLNGFPVSGSSDGVTIDGATCPQNDVTGCCYDPDLAPGNFGPCDSFTGSVCHNGACIGAQACVAAGFSAVASGSSPRAVLGHVPALGLVIAAAELETLLAVAATAMKLVIMLAEVAVLDTFPAAAAMAITLVIMLVLIAAMLET
eukprot:CAMPEP_0178479604 /NCGR_PEP_ID=MMETSP0696-20121128/5267_1 /TAXON_ID=265572 /ORGANISM="Extubocellulus spinifer, Strain CCMP396" /LENGTH=275 /DNA_ID=CAMNT_0020107021 /DNA_START=996 /DNA_END=1820 /DNA_ORIENTATION=+